METVIIFMVGVIVGCVLTKILRNVKSVGTLRVDMSDSDGPYIFLELDKGVGDISTQTHVLLQIKVKNYISQK